MAVTSAPLPSSAVRRLVDYVLDGQTGTPFADELTAWATRSPRFRAFAKASRDKIRKKLRGAKDDDARLDVRAELRAAMLLLTDRRIELAFEAYGSVRGGPDFTVAFKGERPFNIEATRMRRTADATGFGGILLAKLRQLPPSVPNVLLVAIDGDRADAAPVGDAVQALRRRADRNDRDFFADRGFHGTRGFYERFHRLGAVVVACEAAVGGDRVAAWTNASARIPVPDPALRSCLRAFRVGEPEPLGRASVPDSD